ncbi:fumarylacetoacetate hydrolase family protein [Paenibacillus athensensis]|uniref:5-carboxymethyl-2-hydroxymuconate isomerase n=1 Tax=Paenibacillus athensensis TaxID=1967502 RepID=A0A4Y8Q8U0_9BACL|nr:fumarylacetoacetate hydrolase family protein [Paenibacillus athensensis]MCD1260127.1 fumarylacetoacetate hydrolase family protein [Paenibacillus athensensis]
MKLVHIQINGNSRLGIKTDQGIIDVAQAAAAYPPREPLAAGVGEVIVGGREAVQALERYLAELPTDGDCPYLLDETAVAFGPCVPRPGKIICVGLNYRKHAEETQAAIPAYPILFNKFNNALAAHGSEVALPPVTQKVDYEAELAIVIGRTAKYVAKDEALDYVFGYCCANDLSARELQIRTPQWLLGKSLDGFAPLGPYLVTADETGDPNALGIRCTVNGEVRQQSNTADMIFACDEIVSYISSYMTLEPGDVILTGTPEGVMLGYPVERQQYLKPGDVVTVEIDKLGALTIRLTAE